MWAHETLEDTCAFELCIGPVTDASHRTSWARLREFTRRIHISLKQSGESLATCVCVWGGYRGGAVSTSA